MQGEWKIVKISQWLNDLTCYEFKEYAGMFLIKICTESDKRLLTESDLQPLTKLSAILAYYEIEARHGSISEWEIQKDKRNWGSK